jgi:hypothetical protein
MFLKAIAHLALLASTATAHVTRGVGRACGTKAPSQKHIQMTQAIAAEEQQMSLSTGGGSSHIAAGFVIDTWFHVVATSTRESDGYLSVRRLFLPFPETRKKHRCVLTRGK